jgi:hypothetical protein
MRARSLMTRCLTWAGGKRPSWPMQSGGPYPYQDCGRRARSPEMAWALSCSPALAAAAARPLPLLPAVRPAIQEDFFLSVFLCFCELRCLVDQQREAKDSHLTSLHHPALLFFVFHINGYTEIRLSIFTFFCDLQAAAFCVYGDDTGTQKDRNQ